MSEYTANALNALIGSGVRFSVATARTVVTTLHKLENVKLREPVILMNGVLVYDMESKRYIKKELLSKAVVLRITCIIKETGLTGFMYALSGDTLFTYYERLDSEAMKSFVDERTRKHNKKFTQISDFADADTDVIYFCFINSEKNIRMLHEKIMEITGVRAEIYQDIYSK